jgi:hypothetical protein
MQITHGVRFERRRHVGSHRIGILVAENHAGIGWNRHVDRDLVQELAIAVEYLNAAIAAISDEDVALRVSTDAVGRIELTGAAPAIAP